MSPSPPTPGRRVALIASGSFFVGPALARVLATRHHDLVIGDPEAGLVDELEAAGARVEVVNGVGDLADPASAAALVDVARERFGRLDAACMSSGRIVIGRFLESSADDLHTVVRGNLEAPYHFLQAVVAPMVEQGDGQVLVLTSASGARPTPGAPLYSATRAAANMLVRNVALDVAKHGVQVNAVGTNFMDFPEFIRANRADDPEIRAKIESRVPMRRLGALDECASLCATFLDGTSRFVTGQFVAHDGGWA